MPSITRITICILAAYRYFDKVLASGTIVEHGVSQTPFTVEYVNRPRSYAHNSWNQLFKGTALDWLV